jgi:hypothetical protein
MKNVCGLLFLMLLSGRLLSQTPTDVLHKKIKVYLVGTFHFDGAAGDVYKTSKQDMKTPENQKELDDLVRRLASALPDKIFVEWTPERQGYVDTTYGLYLRGQYEWTLFTGSV